MPSPRAASWPMRLAVIGLAIAWVGVLTGLPLYSAVFVLLLLLLLVTAHWRAAALMGLLSPMAFAVAAATVLYAHGSARLVYVGLPGTTFYNLDPELRLPRSTTGCLVTGDEWLTHLPNNATLRLLVAALGPMRGTYAGPYPDRQAAFEALHRARPIPAERFLEDVVLLDGRELKLDRGVGRGLVAGMHWDGAPPDEAQLRASGYAPEPVLATLFQERCLILRVPEAPWGSPLEPSDGPGLERPGRVALVDLERGRPFAFFAPAAGPGHRFPPVSWVKEQS